MATLKQARPNGLAKIGFRIICNAHARGKLWPSFRLDVPFRSFERVGLHYGTMLFSWLILNDALPRLKPRPGPDAEPSLSLWFVYYHIWAVTAITHCKFVLYLGVAAILCGLTINSGNVQERGIISLCFLTNTR